MEMTIDNFAKLSMDQFRSVVKDHLKSMDPNPLDILDLIDDISTDWTDDGHRCWISFISDRYTIANSEFSKQDPNENSIFPNMSFNVIEYFLKKEIYNNGIFNIKLVGNSPLRGFQYWNIVISKIIGRLSSEFSIKFKPDNYFDSVSRGGVSNAKVISINSSGEVTHLSMPVNNLEKELCKVTEVEFQIRVKKKT